MPKFLINDPNDLLVVRVDNHISHVPTGIACIQEEVSFSHNKRKRTSWVSKSAGLDLAYASVDELAPENEKALRKRLRMHYQDGHTSDLYETSLTLYLEKLAIQAADAFILRDIYEEMDEKDKPLMARFFQNGIIYDRQPIPFPTELLNQKDLAEDIVAQLRSEIRYLFPYAPELENIILPGKTYPYAKVDRDKLHDYFDSHEISEKETEQTIDGTIAALRKNCQSTELSDSSKTLIDRVRAFPSRIKDKHLQPLFRLPFTDSDLIIQLSPGAYISDWSPSYIVSDASGTFQPNENIMTLPGKKRSNAASGYEKILGRPVPDFFSYIPIQKPKAISPTLNHIYFEEMFHYVIQAVFKNDCMPYGVDDNTGKASYLKALLADLTADGKTINVAALKELGLEGYFDKRIPLKEQLESSEAENSGNINAEAIAKIAYMIEEEGWGKTAKKFPHLCEDFEQRILPRCYDLCRKKGISVPDTGTPDDYTRKFGRSKRTPGH